MALVLHDLEDLSEQHLAGLGAMVKARMNQQLAEVRRKYTVESHVDQRLVIRDGTNVAIKLLLDHAADELVMRVRADVDMLMDPELIHNATMLDRSRADVERVKSEGARAESERAAASWKEREAERRIKELASEEYLARQVDARFLKKQQELDKKIHACDVQIAEADTKATARIKAEAGVVRVVSVWLRGFTNLGLDDMSKRYSMLELNETPERVRMPPAALAPPPARRAEQEPDDGYSLEMD